MKVSSPSISGLKTIEKASVKDQTLEQLKKYILSGVVRLGERLPSERALADALGVGRYSVREALKVLEAVGLGGVARRRRHLPDNQYRREFRADSRAEFRHMGWHDH